jgi:hypothetical protein
MRQRAHGTVMGHEYVCSDSLDRRTKGLGIRLE